ncbi:Spo0E family sporulation regulatory protein-aspartic acid phosphatase [Ammoniphilus sp. 3BR4]|uniref:Spo0E family sporulation regulatory protein-aspartic acid phosphatase n=1 Tax=Ammoniphilus sp. 3BR4 TaxID=3158265 RepID=UPI00346618B7
MVVIFMLLKRLLEDFNQLRSSMEEASVLYGLADPRVIEYSRKLDDLHNKINVIKYGYKKQIGIIKQ